MASVIDNCDESISCLSLLPEELWIEIFVRASVESLLRLKCVCKRWRSLISNPSFTKKHLQFQKMLSNNTGRFLLQHFDSDRITSYFLFDEASVASAATSSLSHSDILHFSFHETYMGRIVCIEGPVNGLYCVYGTTDRIAIWNPATKEASFLPLPAKCLPGESSSYESDDRAHETYYISFGKLGFGSDPLNEGHYKVVMICVYENESHQEDYYCLLYTTHTNTWRIIENDIFVKFGYRYGPDNWHSNHTYLGGFYYWLAEYEKLVVVAFDMGKEIFKNIPTPNFHSKCHVELVVHNDHITLIVVYGDRSEIDVWELIVEESIWTKKKSVAIEIRGVGRSLGFWKKEDEMLLVIECDQKQNIYQTVLYNTTTREITNLGPTGPYCCLKSLVYYESLVSLSNGITKYRENHTSLGDAIWDFVSGDSMQDVQQRFEALGGWVA